MACLTSLKSWKLWEEMPYSFRRCEETRKRESLETLRLSGLLSMRTGTRIPWMSAQCEIRANGNSWVTFANPLALALFLFRPYTVRKNSGLLALREKKSNLVCYLGTFLASIKPKS